MTNCQIASSKTKLFNIGIEDHSCICAAVQEDQQSTSVVTHHHCETPTTATFRLQHGLLAGHDTIII